MFPTIENTLANAERLVDGFRERTLDIPRVDLGVHISEIFFICATLGDYRPGRILESGRALGQSTYLLGTSYPDVDILSVEIP